MSSFVSRVAASLPAFATRVRPALSQTWASRHAFAKGGASLLTAAALASGCAMMEPTPEDAEMFRHPRLIPVKNDLMRRRFYDAMQAYPDFPKPGIVFQDVFPMFRDPKLVTLMVEQLRAFVRSQYGHVDAIVGLDSRGFLFGPMLAAALGCKFVPVRKKGKLPGETICKSFVKEYGEDAFEVQADSINKGDRVFVVDDLLATGGSMNAGVLVLEKAGAKIVGTFCIVELLGLDGANAVLAPCWSLLRL